jgi:hypothetical protein
VDDKYIIRDTGDRQTFSTGMVRNAAKDKTRYNPVLEGPMFKRWASHLWKGKKVYPDAALGVGNWTLAETEEELQRAKESFFSHVMDYLDGDDVEDHAAAIFFNINLIENIKEKMAAKLSQERQQRHHLQDAIDDAKQEEANLELLRAGPSLQEMADVTKWQNVPPSFPGLPGMPKNWNPTWNPTDTTGALKC